MDEIRAAPKLDVFQLQISVHGSLPPTPAEQHRDDHSADQGDQASNPDGLARGRVHLKRGEQQGQADHQGAELPHALQYSAAPVLRAYALWV